jgi:hypothetical protein
MTIVLFVAGGVYWISTGEKLDETVYRKVLCPFLKDQCFHFAGNEPSHSLIFAPCKKGEIVQPNGATIHLKFVAVDDSDAFREVMRQSPNDYARQLRDAIRVGRIQRTSDPASLIFRISGITTGEVPSQVPFLAENDVCQRMVSVTRMGDGELRFVAPVVTWAPSGEGSIVFPRSLLESSPRAQLCIEPSFRLAYPTETRQNMYCGTGLYESVLRGVPSRFYVMVRAK